MTESYLEVRDYRPRSRQSAVTTLCVRDCLPMLLGSFWSVYKPLSLSSNISLSLCLAAPCPSLSSSQALDTAVATNDLRRAGHAWEACTVFARPQKAEGEIHGQNWGADKQEQTSLLC